MAKRIKDKKPTQLKLASMSENYRGGNQPKKSGKHRSQEIQAMKKLAKKRAKQHERSKRNKNKRS